MTVDRSDSKWDPMRQCEGLGLCLEPFGLRLVPVAEADDKRTYHWFCELHAQGGGRVSAHTPSPQSKCPECDSNDVRKHFYFEGLLVCGKCGHHWRKP